MDKGVIQNMFIQRIDKYPHDDIRIAIDTLKKKVTKSSKQFIDIQYFDDIEEITPNKDLDVVLLFNNIKDEIDLKTWKIYHSLCKKLDLKIISVLMVHDNEIIIPFEENVIIFKKAAYLVFSVKYEDTTSGGMNERIEMILKELYAKHSKMNPLQMTTTSDIEKKSNIETSKTTLLSQIPEKHEYSISIKDSVYIGLMDKADLEFSLKYIQEIYGRKKIEFKILDENEISNLDASESLRIYLFTNLVGRLYNSTVTTYKSLASKLGSRLFFVYLTAPGTTADSFELEKIGHSGNSLIIQYKDQKGEKFIEASQLKQLEAFIIKLT